MPGLPFLPAGLADRIGKHPEMGVVAKDTLAVGNAVDNRIHRLHRLGGAGRHGLTFDFIMR